MSIAEYWDDLVTTALLGTDRRAVPTPPPGGLADLAADAAAARPAADAAAALLAQVAATAAVRRAGVLPGPTVAPLAPPAADPRPVTPPGASQTWERLVAEWPVLEDEWVLAVVQAGRRLSPELVTPLLARHRGDRVRHARVLVAAGPLGQWMVEWVPALRCTARAPMPEAELLERMAGLPELPIVPQLATLCSLEGRAGAATVAQAVAGGLSAGTLTVADRAVLVNLVARLHPSVLLPLSAALRRVDPSRPAIGLALALADLAALRHHLLAELEPA
ncbi:MAG: hypothetical protein R2694_01145 [Ilumatobacteraceae bacterium]